MNTNISILGTGMWGTAIAQVLAVKYPIILWSKNAEQVNQINTINENKSCFPNIKLLPNIIATNNLQTACQSNIIIISIPINNIRMVLNQITNLLPNTILISPSKGIEICSGKIATEIYQEYFPNLQLASISGPNFAKELIQLLPSITTIAANNKSALDVLSQVFLDTSISATKSDHLLGIQLAGAYKNIAAIACGLVYNQGVNTHAAMFNNCMHEMKKFLNVYYCEKNQIINDQIINDIIFSPAGISDMFATCSSTNSRNFQFGIALAKGETINNLLCEGMHTLEAIASKVEHFPIAHNLYKLIYKKIR